MLLEIIQIDILGPWRQSPVNKDTRTAQVFGRLNGSWCSVPLKVPISWIVLTLFLFLSPILQSQSADVLPNPVPLFVAPHKSFCKVCAILSVVTVSNLASLR